MNDSQRLKYLIDLLGLTPYKFAKSLDGYRTEAIYHVLRGDNGLSKKMVDTILKVYPMINMVWLMTGIGSPFNNSVSGRFVEKIADRENISGKVEMLYKSGYWSQNPIFEREEISDEELDVFFKEFGIDLKNEYKKLLEKYLPSEKSYSSLNADIALKTNVVSEPAAEYKKNNIPLLDVSAWGGGMLGEAEPQYLTRLTSYHIPGFEKADYLIPVSGDSMEPQYRSGDIIAVRKIDGREFLQWGRVHVLDTNQGVVLKQIYKGSKSDVIKCVSSNSRYEPFEIRLSDCHGIYLVLGLVRLD